ncbi:hypothetical protein DM02DRAFT_541272, partial [Periconia macrospinosa]
VIFFTFKAKLLYKLIRKGADWKWGADQQLAMRVLKTAVTSAPALVTINYKLG